MITSRVVRALLWRKQRFEAPSAGHMTCTFEPSMRPPPIPSPRKSFSLERPSRTLEMPATWESPARTDARFFELAVDEAPLPMAPMPTPPPPAPARREEAPLPLVIVSEEHTQTAVADAPSAETLELPPRVEGEAVDADHDVGDDATFTSLVRIRERELRGERRWKIRIAVATLLLGGVIAFAYRGSLRAPRDADDARTMVQSALAYVVREAALAPK